MIIIVCRKWELLIYFTPYEII